MARIVHYRPVKPPVDPSRTSWFTRGALLGVFAALTLIGVLAYAGPSAAVVAYRLFVDGVWLVLWLAAAEGVGTLCLGAFLPDGVTVAKPVDARDAGPGSPAPLLAVTSVALGLGVLGLCVLGLGLAGWLNRVTATLLLIGGLASGAPRWLRRDQGDEGSIARRWLAAPATWEWVGLAAAPFLAIAIVGAMLPPGLLWSRYGGGDPHGYDVVEYHLQVPREWYEAGRILPLHHNVFSYFPFNVEVHYLLAMHLRGGPWAGMYLAQEMHVAFVALSVLAVYAVARRAGSRASAIVAAVVVASVPWMTQLASVAYDEGGFLLYATLAIGWAMWGLSERQLRIRRFAIAGAMAGLACGVKLTAAPEVAVALAIAATSLLVIRRRDPGEARVAWIAPILAFLFTAGLFFGPWLARNVAWAGNPVFPEATRLLGRGHFSAVQQERWERAHSPRPDQRNLSKRLDALVRQGLLGWQYGYVIFPFAIVGAVAGYRSRGTWLLVLLLAFLIFFWLAFTHLQGRFLILAVPLCGLLIAQIEWRRFAPVGVVLALAIAIAGWVPLDRGIRSYLYGSATSGAASLNFVDVLGREQFWPMQEFTEHVPEGATLILIGDARAFWFPNPMSQLRYRTIFDVDAPANADAIEAWTGASDAGAGKDAWLFVSPEELDRFQKTYAKVPQLPKWALRAAARTGNGSMPFIIAPQRVKRGDGG